MRAVQMSTFGAEDVLRYVDLAVPDPGAGEVRVRLHAAGVNPADTYIRTGTYAFFKPKLPWIPGFDGAGIVDAVGAGVDRVGVGDRVFVAALLAARNTGMYAEMAVCDAAAVHRLPDAMSFAQGAAIGVPSVTAYRALFQRARLRAGETVLVHGASGGVGTLAVQLARAYGARVIGTAGTADGLGLVQRLGAHSALDHSRPDYLDHVLSLTGGRGVDVIIEMLANVNLERDFNALAKYGRIVIVGNRGSLEFTPRLAMIKEADVFGMAVWNATPREYAEALSAVAAAMESGVLRPIVGRELPLAKAARAHADILQEKARGKMVLTID